jgi:hypothetical protein
MTKILLLCDEVGSWSKEGKKVGKESWEKKGMQGPSFVSLRAFESRKLTALEMCNY